nr:putative type VI secretion system effector [Acinetobacter sp. Marseille-Q1620]
MDKLIKFEGRVVNLNIKNSTLNLLGKHGDKQVIASSLFSAISGSLSLASQSIFLASRSKLNVHAFNMRVGDKVCIGQFHRVLFEETEYVICVARKLDNGFYEPYAVLSPVSGLLHMQVEMGTAVKPHDLTIVALAKFLFIIVFCVALFFTYMAKESFWESLFENLIIFLGAYVVIISVFWIVLRTGRHFALKSEKVFEMYGFDDYQDIRLAPARYLSDTDKLLLESVYDYRKVIEKDPYPESYINQDQEER